MSSIESTSSDEINSSILIPLIVLTIFTFIQTALLGVSANSFIPNLNDSNAKQSLSSFSRDWAIAMGVFGGISVIMCFSFLAKKEWVATLVLIWFILMIIVNLILFGFGFYFLSVVLSSSDYTSGDQTTVTLRNIFISLLVFTGITLLTLISGILWSRYRNKISSVFSKDPTVEDFFESKEYSGEDCKKWFDIYKKRIPILKKLFKTFDIKTLEGSELKETLKDFAKFSQADVENLGKNLGIITKPTGPSTIKTVSKPPS